MRMRARALSTLGGTFRVGLFIGPFVGAALVVRARRSARAYAFAAAMSLAAAALTAFLPDVTRTQRAIRAGHRASRTRRCSRCCAQHRRTLLTLGTGVLIISAARATRQTIVPLWAASQGLSPAHGQPRLRGVGRGRHAALLSGRRDHGPLRPGVRRRAVDGRARARLPAAAADPRHPGHRRRRRR